MKKYEEENYKYENICDKIYPWVKPETYRFTCIERKTFFQKRCSGN